MKSKSRFVFSSVTPFIVFAGLSGLGLKAQATGDTSNETAAAIRSLSDNQCDAANDRAKTLSENADTAKQNYFKAEENQADQAVTARQTANSTANAIANAQSAYTQAISTIQLKLPSEIQSIQDNAAKALLEIKSKMIELGKQVIEAADLVQQAQTAYDTAVSGMLATCTNFAGTKANAKLKTTDAKIEAQKGHMNYSGTSLSGVTNRTQARRVRDSQAAYASAFKSCMSGQTDPNGDDPGPGPGLAKTIVDAKAAIAVAQAKSTKLLAIVAQQQALLQQGEALNEQAMSHQVQAATAAAQNEANQALTVLKKTVNDANTAAANAAVPSQVKGSLWNEQMGFATMQSNSAGIAANKAAAAADACISGTESTDDSTEKPALEKTRSRGSGTK